VIYLLTTNFWILSVF